MSVWLICLLFVLGLLLIIKGGDFFVDASSWIAEASGIPKFIVGATIVSVATTLPELLVSLMSASQGSVGIAVGNAVGSVTANVGLIMGLSIVCLPSLIERSQMLIKSLLLILACALLYLFSTLGGSSGQSALPLPGAWVLLAFFAYFIYNNVSEAKKEMKTANGAADVPKDKKTIAVNIAKFIFGAVGIVVGAQLLVDNGTLLAKLFGVPDSVIGATLIAVGTSLPELVTTLTAIAKRQSAMSIGNIVGANIIDLTVILPICAIASGKPLPILSQNIALDMPVCLILLLIALVPTLAMERFHRLQGAVLLAGYAAYIAVLCTGVVV